MNRQERRRQAKTGGNGDAELVRLAFQRHQAGDLPGAEALYRQVLRAAPDQPDALRLLGEVCTDRGKGDEAIALLRRLTQLQPRHFIAHYSLGNAYRLAGQLEPAIACYQAAIALDQNFAGAYHGLGAALRAAAREGEAAENFQLAVVKKPDWALAWKDLGLMRAILGELEAAEAALRRAVALDPAFGEARRHLAAIRRDEPDAQETAALLARAADAQIPVAEKIDIFFALGRAADKAREFDAAFGHFAQANRLARATSGAVYDRARMTRDVDALIAAFTPEVFARQGDLGDPSEAPVFILGMPRAGSTLFEQIAASHGQVFGAGERKGIGGIAQKIGWRPSDRWSREAIQAAAAQYLAALEAISGGAPRIIDKLPDNVFQLGLIAALFPHARVIFCARDARDVCLSCFFQHFSEPYGFDTDLADCAHRYRETERLIRHWRAVLPLSHITFSYEALLADLPGQARRLIDFLGLEWDAECLNFHRQNRPVRTASWSQVRRPLYQESAGRWRNYAAHLTPLFDALGPA